MVDINNFGVISRGISGWARFTQRFIYTFDSITFAFQHKRNIACVLETAPLTAYGHVFRVSEIGKFSSVYSSHQSDVIMNYTRATLAEI